MKVKIVKLREQGRKLPKDRTTEAYAIEGDLELIQYISTKRGYSYAKVTEQKSGGLIVYLAELYEPQIVTINGSIMVFDGLEKMKDGQTFLQHWKCLVI